MKSNSAYDKVKAFRDDTAASVSEISFKKAVLGGYDCKEVVEYIQTLKNNMQLSEKAYNDMFEEYSSSSKMYLQEREKLNKKTAEQEEEIRLLNARQLEKSEREKGDAELIQKENAELKSMIQSLQDQIENSEQNKKSEKEIEEIVRKNQKLIGEICELTESKNKLDLQNATLTTELNKAVKQNENLKTETEEFRKTIAILKISKRELAMNANMNVFEYQQSHLLNINTISKSISDISSVLTAMKADLSDLAEKSTTNFRADELD